MSLKTCLLRYVSSVARCFLLHRSWGRSNDWSGPALNPAALPRCRFTTSLLSSKAQRRLNSDLGQARFPNDVSVFLNSHCPKSRTDRLPANGGSFLAVPRSPPQEAALTGRGWAMHPLSVSLIRYPLGNGIPPEAVLFHLCHRSVTGFGVFHALRRCITDSHIKVSFICWKTRPLRYVSSAAKRFLLRRPWSPPLPTPAGDKPPHYIHTLLSLSWPAPAPNYFFKCRNSVSRRYGHLTWPG